MNAYLLQAQWKRRAGGLVSVWLMAFLGGAAFAQGPANDDFANATLLSGTNLAVTGTTLNATAEPGEPPHCGHPAAHSIWYTWTAPANGSVLIDLTDSMPGSTVSVYTGKYLTTLVSIDCNVDGNPDATGRCIFPVTAGLVYEIAIDITGGPGGPVNMFLVFTSSVFPPIITAQPASQSTVQGASPIFSVVASGVPAPAYQWLFEGVDLPGATNSTLLLTNVALSQTGPYQVIASNPGGSVTSVVATLTVIPRPANDDFADRVQLNGTNIITAGSNTYATVEPGEPVGGWSGVQSVWWTWTAPTNGIVNVSAANFTGNQVLFIFTGEELTNLQLVASANSFSPPVAVQFETGTGTNFQIAVEGVFNDGGNFQLDLNFTASNFPPVFLCQPSNVTVLQGGSATFSVCVSSALPYSLQWFFDGNPLAGATNSSLVLNNVLSNKEGTYTVLVSSASGSVLGNPASLTVNVPPANDDLANRTPISGLSFSTTGDNQFATSEPGEPDHGGFPPGASVWWSWTTPSIGEAHVSVTGFSGEETLGVYTNAQLASLASVVSNVWTNGPLTVHFNAAAGETYQIAVADPSGLGGPFQLQVLLNLSNFPPTIVQQPPPVTNVAAGSVIYFTNVVDSDFWVTNVWYFETSTNGPAEAIGGWGIDGWGDGGGPGGSGDGSGWGGDGGGGGGDGFGGGDGGGGGYNLSLGLTNLESGYYYTVVTSYGGSVTSSPTYLIVHFPPSNDDFTNRIPLSGVSLSAPGTTAYATLEAGEPAYPGLTSGGSVWWTWTAPANGTAYVGVTNTNAAFQVLEAFTGNALTNLVSVAEAGGAQYVVAESFPVTTGMTYQIAVAGEQSAITVGLQFESASAPPVITQQPYPVTVPAGGSAFFQVGAAGGGMLLYQWYFNTNTLLAGATNSVLQLSGVTTNEQGFYSVSVGNLVGSTNSQQAYLTVTLRPPNDNFANRIALTGTNASTAGSDQYATFETGEPAPGAFSNAKSVWWTYTAPADGKITITLTNYTGDQILSAYTGGSLLSLKNVATEFFYQTNSGQPISVQFSSASGTTFQIQVEELSGGGANGSFDLSLLFTPEIFPPVITNQPTLTHAVTNGNNVVLQVGATGAPPISYQWLFNGANLPGETNTVLELDNVATSAAGSYSVLATNPGGTTASQTVNLIVHQRPPNDFFTNRIALSGELVQTTGSNFWASAEPGEPAHAGYGSFATVWWSYTTTNFGLIKVDLTGSFSGADLGVYTGTNVGELTLVASNAFGNPDGTGAVTFLGQPGTEYEIAVQGALKGNFPVAGSISLSVAELLPPAIVDQPANQYVGSGENAIFEVEATSTSPLTYQWQFGGANLPNQTNSTLIVSNAEANNAGSYSVVVGNAVGNVQSSNVLLTLVSVLTGEVTDAVTGLPLPGVRIMVGTNTTSTDALGDYRIPGVSAGVFADFTAGPRSGPVPLTVQFTNLTVLNGAQLVAVTNGYANYTNDTLQLATDDVVTNVFSMSPLLPEYPMHFVLNWAAQPRDLDGHLLIPAIDGTSYHVYYPPQYRGSLDSLPFAELNTDVTNGYGPETITVAQFFPGLYSYFVEKFAGIGDLNSSKATVEVYNEEALLTTFEVPTNGTGNFWYVCDIDGETMAISPVNEIQSAEPAMMHKPVAPRGGGWTGGDHPMNGSENPSYLWDFGDGTTSTEENPLKTYNNRGVYSVALTVVAGGMTNSLLRTNYINVSGTSSPPGVALVAPSPGALFALGTAITLSAAVTPGTGEVTNVAFYDGTMFLGQTNQSPYTIIWTNAPPGSNGLTAIVSSSDGLSSASGLVSVTVDIPPAITQQPTNLTVPQGAAAQFTVVATGTVPLSYQWEVGGAPLPGATKSTLVLTNVQPSQMGKYSVVVTNLVGAVTSSAAALRVRPPNAPQVLITNPVAGSIFKEGVPIPIDAQLIPGTGAVTNVSFYDGTLLLGQTNQSPYAIIWTNLPPGSNGLTAIVSSADGLAGTSAVVSITVDIPPAIVQQPTNQTVLKGASVTFIVAATGSAPLSYQWELGGAPLPGATNTTLVLTNVQPSQMGKYSVVVTNLVGAVTSSAAALRVQLPDAPQVLITNPVTGSVLKEGVPITIDTQLIPGTGAVTNVSFYDGTVLLGETNLSPYSIIWTNAPAGSNGLTAVAIANGGLVTTSAVVSITVDLPPVISQQPASQTVPEEAKVTFTVGATGTAPLFYQWELDGNVLAGASNATLVLSNVQITQSGNYTVIVTNIVGAVTSQPATLNVLAQRVPVITWATPVPVVYGTPLGAAQLDATASVGGTFSYSPLAGTVLDAGTHVLSGTFSPSDTADYTSTIASVSLAVTPAPLLVLASNADRAYGQDNPPLIGFILGLTNGDVITASYGSGATSSSKVGTYLIVPSLSDPHDRLSNYTVTVSNGTLTVTQAVPVLSWPAPASITYGTPLGSGQLDATANVTGAHNYNPPAGSVLVAGVHTLTDVFTPADSLDYRTVTTTVSLTVLPGNTSSISLTTLGSQSSYCSGGTIALQASVNSSANPPASVAFYAEATTFLGSTNAAPYDLSWTPASSGSYSLTATVTFADGSTLTSEPLVVIVSPACGQVALVANGPAPELNQLTNLLLVQMGLTSTLFTQAGLTSGALAPFELVVWDNLGGQTNQITDNTVNVLGSLWSNGVPLYLMGDHLAAASLQFASSNWVQLTGLLPASGTGGTGSITFSSPLIADPIVIGPFGTVSNFVYPLSVDAASPVDTNADATLGQSGTEPVFLTAPPTDVAVPGLPPRLATQNFQTTGGADPSALAQRQALFLNTVAWLLQYQPCPQFSAGVTWSWPNPPIVGQPLTIQGVAGNNGECDAVGVILTNWLPAGMKFAGAQSQIGAWKYDAVDNAVIFELGLLPRQQSLYATLSFTVVPTLPGTFTNLTDVIAYGRFIQQIPNPITVTGLTLAQLTATNYLLQLGGVAGQSYQIQSSANLLDWLDWTNVLGPSWQTVLSTALPAKPRQQFYRALEQP